VEAYGGVLLDRISNNERSHEICRRQQKNDDIEENDLNGRGKRYLLKRLGKGGSPGAGEARLHVLVEMISLLAAS